MLTKITYSNEFIEVLRILIKDKQLFDLILSKNLCYINSGAPFSIHEAIPPFYSFIESEEFCNEQFFNNCIEIQNYLKND